jgi:hypothetical protein
MELRKNEFKEVVVVERGILGRERCRGDDTERTAMAAR